MAYDEFSYSSPPPPCIKNGITKEQRIEATQNIHKIFPNAIYKETQKASPCKRLC